MENVANNVTVSWVFHDKKYKNCTVKTELFNGKDCIIIVRPEYGNYVIEIASVRNTYRDTENLKRLRVNTETNRYWLEFADSDQAADWLKRINILQEKVESSIRKLEESLLKSNCNIANNVTVTWIFRDKQYKNCTVKTELFNGKDCIIIVRPEYGNYVIEIASVRNTYRDTDNLKRLRVNTETNRYWLEFADSDQAADWLERINVLQEKAKFSRRKTGESILKSNCNIANNVTVTWLFRDKQYKNCTVKTELFNGKDCIIIVRPEYGNYVIEIASVRNTYRDTENLKRLRVNTETNRYWFEFTDSDQAADWQEMMITLQKKVEPLKIKQEALKVSPQAEQKRQKNSNNMEIPYDLRAEVKLAVFETGCMGPIGAFSSAADVAAIGGWWGYLLMKYCEYYGVEISKESAKQLSIAVLLGLGAYYQGCKNAARLFNMIPGGMFAAMGVSALQNIVFTYRFAITLTRMFNDGAIKLDTFVDSIKYTFVREFASLATVKDIADLYMHY